MKLVGRRRASESGWLRAIPADLGTFEHALENVLIHLHVRPAEREKARPQRCRLRLELGSGAGEHAHLGQRAQQGIDLQETRAAQRRAGVEHGGAGEQEIRRFESLGDTEN